MHESWAFAAIRSATMSARNYVRARHHPRCEPKRTPADDAVSRISEATKCSRSAAHDTGQTFQTIAEQHPIFTALAAQGLAWAALFLWT